MIASTTIRRIFRKLDGMDDTIPDVTRSHQAMLQYFQVK